MPECPALYCRRTGIGVLSQAEGRAEAGSRAYPLQNVQYRTGMRGIEAGGILPVLYAEERQAVKMVSKPGRFWARIGCSDARARAISDSRNVLDAVLNHLDPPISPRSREIAERVFWLGQTHRTVAHEMNLNGLTVENHLLKIKARLRAYYRISE